MKRLLAGVIALGVGCGGSSSGSDVDAGPGGGADGGAGSGDAGGGDDGGTTGPRTVEVTLANRPNNAAQFSFFVAYQDGSAAWKLAPAPTGDTYAFEVNAPSWGIAFTCIATVAGQTTTQQRTVTSAHFATSERSELTLDVPARCSDRAAALVPLTGTVTNRPDSGVLFVQYGTRTAFVGSQTGNFTMQVPPGTRDLLVSRAIPQGNGDFYVEDVLVERNVSVNAATVKQLDFDDAQPTSFYTVDTTGTPQSARVIASTTLYTANGTTAQLSRLTSEWETDALDDAQMIASDVYDQSIQVATFGASATITHATATPGEQSWEAPAPLGMVTTTVPTKMPYVTLQSTWPSYTDAIGFTWSATQQVPCTGFAGGCSIVWSSYLSPGVTGSSPGYRMPDLASLSGWKDQLQLVSGVGLAGTVTAFTSSAGPGDFPTGIPAAGTDRTLVRRDFALTP